ncbi:MAG: hypothetical protein EA401_05810 [Planctomycetota bacterium]|nr:MAG: hypothetical protein EA401_05810 [Planctomycetota bacterium]
MWRFSTQFLCFSTLLAACSLVACGRGDTSADAQQHSSPDAEAQRAQAQQPRDLRSAISTISESDGQTLVEIPLGSDHEITPGTLMRVLDPEQDGYLKGMLQVLSVPEPELSLARQIGLLDRRNPIAVGDPVMVIDDVSELAASGAVSRRVQEESQRQERDDDDRHQQFSELRRNFQQELQRLEQHYQQQINDLHEEHEQAISQLQEEHSRTLQRRESEHRTELSAVREALADEAVQELRRDRDRRRDEVRRLAGENARLQTQIETLSQELQVTLQRLRQAEEQRGRDRQAWQREIRAELETREILEQRIRELEVRLGLPGSRAPAVLVGDEGREETVLARLERVSRERNDLLAELHDVREQLIVATGEIESGSDSGEARTLQVRSANLEQELARSQSRLEALRERLSGLEVLRLQAERNYFDLATQVLRLPGSNPSLKQLQDRLHRNLAEMVHGPQEEE